MEQPKLIDIYPVVGKPFEYYFNLKTIGLGILLFALLVGTVTLIVYFLYRYLTSAPQKAKRALQKLKNKPCLTDAQAKETVSSVSEVVRGFLVKTYELSSTGMTDAEIIAFLQTKTVDLGTMKNAERLLLGTHHLRFSSESVQTRECEQLINDAMRFIKTFPLKNSHC